MIGAAILFAIGACTILFAIAGLSGGVTGMTTIKEKLLGYFLLGLGAALLWLAWQLFDNWKEGMFP